MNWQEFFTDYSIEYVTRSPNTKRGELSTKCPWCGEDDPSQHLGVSLTSENWGCLRDPQHRGHSPVRLVAALLGCPQPQAGLVVAQYSRPDPAGFDTLAALTLTSEAPSPVAGLVEAKPPLSPIKPSGSTAKFWRYLENRGFDPMAVITAFRLRACLTGQFKDRLIIPLYRDGELFAWTGRALVDPVNAPRYLSSLRVKETIFHEDVLFNTKANLLFITEGPFDAMKLDHYGWSHGARATCTFGTSISVEQIMLLSKLCKRFSRVVVLFDADALGPAFYATDWLRSPNVSFGRLPDGVKDPGELSKDQVRELINDPR